ncbi:MAG TPA: hypothetical protein VK899_12715, partial [Gemmatimonadales bacterium]|nr:hypothetical protein [Gemmatimonadales bacterium]
MPANPLHFATLLATFAVLLSSYGAMRFPGRQPRGGRVATVFSCDYNGWTDVPEAEREAIEAFELA